MSSVYYKAEDTGPTLVQGHDVQKPQGAVSQALSPAATHNMSTPVAQYQTPEPAQRGCRDAIFAVIFYAHLGLIAWAAASYTPTMVGEVGEGVVNYRQGWGDRRRLDEEQDNNNDEHDDNNEENDGLNMDFDATHLTMIALIAAFLSFVLSSCALGLMISCAKPLIKMALVFNIGLFAMLMILSFVSGAMPMGIVFLVLMGISSCFAYRVWNRIPFAAANLVTAVTAVRANMGLAVCAYWSVILLFAWSIVWVLSSTSTIFVLANCNGKGECEGSVNGFLIFFFFLSFYWTSEVIANVVTVTTAGTVGTWWFHPNEAGSCCSRGECVLCLSTCNESA